MTVSPMFDERVRLSGLCRLDFEGQEFKPSVATDHNSFNEYWLSVSRAARRHRCARGGGCNEEEHEEEAEQMHPPTITPP